MQMAANEPPSLEPVENYGPPTDEIAQPQPEVAPEAQMWVCAYDPTMNNDWHDDVLCQKGSAFDRPYLREWDDFITEDEIMESAREYEAALNAAP